jgi:dynein heavy chain
MLPCPPPHTHTEALAPITDQLAEARDDLAAIKDVWDTAQLCERQFDTWRGTLWAAIRVDEMEDGTKALVKEVKNLSKKVRPA